MNSYKERYPTCERTYAKLRIDPGDKFPEEITRLLNITPTKTRSKGSEIIGHNKKTKIVKMNLWLLSSESKIDSKDLRRHLDWLLDLLEPARSPLLDLQNTKGVRMDISCVWWSAHGHGGPTLNPIQNAENVSS